jgi:hypothetical protein
MKADDIVEGDEYAAYLGNHVFHVRAVGFGDTRRLVLCEPVDSLPIPLQCLSRWDQHAKYLAEKERLQADLLRR